MRRCAISVFVLGLIAVAVQAGCAPVDPAPPEERMTTMLGGIEVRVTLADDADERSRGLQGHEPLEPGEGMLFVFTDSAIRTFAMKEVAFPIDVVFIGRDLTVSAIEPLEPGDERLVRSPGPSSYVIELPQGWAAENGIVIGSAFVPPR